MINNFEKFYNSREEVINFFRDYIEMLSDANYNAKQNEILTPKQILQRLPTAQVKAGNNIESLLTEIRQSKQISKKVYNDIIKSIQ